MTSTGSGTAKSATSSISPSPIQRSISRCDDGHDRLPQRRDRAGREVRRHGSAVPCLLRRVAREHGRDRSASRGARSPGAARPRDRSAPRRCCRTGSRRSRGSRRIGHDQLVAGDQVEVGALDREDGARLLHGAVVRERALLDGGVERVEVVQVDCRRQLSPSSALLAAHCARLRPQPAPSGSIAAGEITDAVRRRGDRRSAGAAVRDGGGRDPRASRRGPGSTPRRRCGRCSRAAGPTARPIPRLRGRPPELRGALPRRGHARPPAGRRPRRAARRPGGHRHAELPRVVRRVLGRGVDRRRRRAAQRVVDRTGAGVRPGRLRFGRAVLRRRAGRAAGRVTCRTSTALRATIVAKPEPGAALPDGGRHVRGALSARWTLRPSCRSRDRSRRTTPRSSTPRARPAARRARSARSATSART